MKEKVYTAKPVKQKSVFKDTRRSLFILSSLIIFILLFYCIASLFTSIGYETFLQAQVVEEKITAVINNKFEPLTIVLDPGHGGEDPGAVANGQIEKNLNLQISNKLYELLSASGYNVVMTRTTDVLLYGQGEEKQKKHFDVRNRLKIVQSYENCIYVGIHMNKFPIEKYSGLQTFFSENNEASRTLALTVQDATKLLLTENNRTVRPENDTIYILRKAEVPAILIECGFLSNQAEAQKLADNTYQEKLAFTIYCGITKFLGENNKQG